MTYPQKFETSFSFLMTLLLGSIIGVYLGGKIAGIEYFHISSGDFFGLILSMAIVLISIVNFRLARVKDEGSEKGRNIDDLIRKLECVYGPIYNILNQVEYYNPNSEDEFVIITPSEKDKLDAIFSTYSYLIDKDIHNYWREHLHKPRDVFIDTDSFRPSEYIIRNIFVEMINEKYGVLNKSYDESVRVWSIVTE